jgi:hypothetical protein
VDDDDKELWWRPASLGLLATVGEVDRDVIVAGIELIDGPDVSRPRTALRTGVFAGSLLLLLLPESMVEDNEVSTSVVSK